MHTGCPPTHCPPPHSHTIGLRPYSRITLCKLQRTSFDCTTDRFCFSFFYFLPCRPVKCGRPLYAVVRRHMLWSTMWGMYYSHLKRAYRSPPNALPSTQSYYSTATVSRMFPLCRTLCKLQRTSFDCATDRFCFSFF